MRNGLFGIMVGALLTLGAHAAPGPWVLALDKAQGGAPLVLVIQEHDGALAGEAYTSPYATQAVAADATKLTTTDTTLKGEVTVEKTGAYVLAVAVKDGAPSGTYTGTTGDQQVAGAVRPGADLLPLGHALFYPSAEHPIGYRGDGNGFFPGARVPTAWWDGTPIERPGGRNVTPDFADSIQRNIVWKTVLPSWGNSAPLVVGDKVFTIGEPDLLTCVDARTGALLWSVPVNAWTCAGVEAKAAEQARELHSIWLTCANLNGFLLTRGTVGGDKPFEVEHKVAQDYLDIVLPRLGTALKTLDPDGDYAGALKATADGLQMKLALKEGERPAKHALERSYDALPGLLRSRIAALTGKKIRLGRGWNNLCGIMAWTASDGQYVYAAMGQGQVACYTLDGKLVWGACPFKKIGDEFYDIPHGSPLLIGNILYTMCGLEAVALDKTTGKTLWSAPIGDTTVAIAKVVRLDLAGAPMDVIVTPDCQILRPADGKVLGRLPYADAENGVRLGRGVSVVSSGPIVYMSAAADNYVGPLKAFRLTAESADRVTATLIWQTREYRGGDTRGDGSLAGRAATPETYYSSRVFDAETGAIRSNYQDGVGGYSSSLIGDRYYWSLPCINSAYQAWNGRRADGKALCDFGAATADGQALALRNRLGGTEIPHVPELEKWVPELYAYPPFENGSGGRPGHFYYQDSGMMPQGNRLFIRSLKYLYCIGDPAEPYCGRAQALGDALLDDPKADKLDAIVAKLASADRETQLAAARALRALGPAAAPAAATLATLYMSADDAQANVGALGLSALGVNGAGVIDDLVAYGKAGGAVRTRAVAVLADMGERAIAIAEGLLGDEQTYPYAVEMLAAMADSDAKAVALARATLGRDKGRGNARPAGRQDAEQAWIVAGELLRAMGPAAKAAGPLLQDYAVNGGDDRECMRIAEIMADIAPDRCVPRIPFLLSATRAYADNQWNYGRPLTVLRKLGGRAADALPHLQAIANEGKGRAEFRTLLQETIQSIGMTAGQVLVAMLINTPALVGPGGETTITWKTVNATQVSLAPAIGAVKPEGSVTVTPAETTTYTLTAEGPGGPITQTLTIRVLTLRAPVAVADAKPGLRAEYFALNGANGSLPKFADLKPDKSDVVTAVDGLVTDTGFAGSGRKEQVAARLTGFIDVPQDGAYTFYTGSDDGSALLLGDEVVVNNDGAHGMQELSGQVALKAGKHPITVLYAQGGGDYGLVLRWEGPGIVKDTVPAAALWHTP